MVSPFVGPVHGSSRWQRCLVTAQDVSAFRMVEDLPKGVNQPQRLIQDAGIDPQFGEFGRDYAVRFTELAVSRNSIASSCIATSNSCPPGVKEPR